MSGGYHWDPHHNLDNTPLMPAPAWLAYHPEKAGAAAKRAKGEPFDPQQNLDEHCALIRSAGNGSGERYAITNRSAFSIGTMIGRGMLDKNAAWATLKTAVGILAAGDDDEKQLLNGAKLAFVDGVAKGEARGPWRPRP